MNEKPLDQIFIKDIMTKDVVLLTPESKMSDACQRMRQFNIRHLPVVNDKEELIGIFTDRDLNRAYSPKETETGWYYSKSELDLMNLHHFMTKEPRTLSPDDTLKDAIRIMSLNKFGCIPVTDSNSRVIGIISYIDILKYMNQYF